MSPGSPPPLPTQTAESLALLERKVCIVCVSDSFLLISSHPVKNDRKTWGHASSSSNSSLLSLHFVKFPSLCPSGFPLDTHTVHILTALAFFCIPSCAVKHVQHNRGNKNTWKYKKALHIDKKEGKVMLFLCE